MQRERQVAQLRGEGVEAGVVSSILNSAILCRAWTLAAGTAGCETPNAWCRDR
jgi:hypothetical protein